MFRIGIVEDNGAEALVLKEHLERYAQSHDLTLRLQFYKEASELMGCGDRFDLLFLDIDLPGMDGFEAATLLRSYDQVTPIIFVTSLAQYAIRGYEVEALDFMVKPVSYSSLSLRMDKAVRVMRRNRSATLSISTKDGLRVVALRDIAYVEAAGHYCIYHLADGSQVKSRASISSVSEQLPDDLFVRISISHLANMAHIELTHGNAIRLTTGDTLYLSRSRKREALASIAGYLGKSI